MRVASLFGGLVGLAAVVALFAAPAASMGLVVAALPAWGLGRWVDSYRRRTVLLYDLDPSVAAAYEALTRAFDGMIGCAGKWHISSGGLVQDLTTWKRNAGASHLVAKKATAVTYGLPAVIACNLVPPSAAVGSQIIYFLPDVALVADGRTFGAVSYADLRLRWEPSRFIEEGSVPSDATVVDHTWKHPNKSGGPDRRFKSNHQIPVCLYEVLHLTSSNGVNELLEFSRCGVSAPFADAVAALARLPRSAPPLPSPA